MSIVSMKIVRGFDSKANFLELVNKSKVNKRHQEVLDKAGAFASIEPGLPARHPDRLKDQVELMPGLVVDVIRADRDIVMDATIKTEVVKLMNDVRNCELCSLAGGVHPKVAVGKSPKFMVVTDSPNWSEEEHVQMLKGKASEYLLEAISSAELKPNMGYFTSAVKSPKVAGKLTTEQIGACSQYLKREVDLLKPPVIVALGSAAIRHFVPDVKGGIADLAGQVVYVPALDASVVFGINPMMIGFEPSRQNSLNETFEKVAELLS